MVEDRVTDGKRIAQLLASELSGLETGPLAAVAVADADPDAEPTPGGTVAYRVTYRDEQVGTARIYPERAVLSLSAGDRTEVSIGSGAAVKRTVDTVRETLRDAADG